MRETLDQFKGRMAKLRRLRELSGAPMSACDEALKACGGDVEAAARHPTLRTRDTGDPFLSCPHPGGAARDHRGKLYHAGCPEAHGGPARHSTAPGARWVEAPPRGIRIVP